MTARLSYNRPDLRKQINKMKRRGITGKNINEQNAETKSYKHQVNNVKNQSQNIELLEKYNELFKNGVITEEEFKEKKKELL